MTDYQSLSDVLTRALSQAAEGKGKERHATPVSFDQQGICRRIKTWGPGFAYGQVEKKMEEAERLPVEMAVNELLGAIVHLAAVVIVKEGAK